MVLRLKLCCVSLSQDFIVTVVYFPPVHGNGENLDKLNNEDTHAALLLLLYCFPQFSLTLNAPGALSRLLLALMSTDFWGLL